MQSKLSSDSQASLQVSISSMPVSVFLSFPEIYLSSYGPSHLHCSMKKPEEKSQRCGYIQKQCTLLISERSWCPKILILKCSQIRFLEIISLNVFRDVGHLHCFLFLNSFIIYSHTKDTLVLTAAVPLNVDVAGVWSDHMGHPGNLLEIACLARRQIVNGLAEEVVLLFACTLALVQCHAG